MKSTGVAPREAEVIDAIEERGLLVFRPRDVRRFLGLSDRNVYRVLGNMTEKGLVRRLARGTYVLSETYETYDSYAIASHLEPASYIACWSALHFHDMTGQVPRTMFVAVTTQKRPLEIQGQPVRFVRVSPATFFGYDRYGDAVVSTPEKTVLDCLRLPEYAGGIGHVFEALTDELEIDRLGRYATRLGNGAVAARAGYLLEQRGLDAGLDPLRELIGSYTKLDPAGERTNPNADWKLYVNVDLHD